MFSFHNIVVAAAGFVLGAFCPSLGRKIKSLFVKETQAVNASGAVASVKSQAESAVSGVLKKL